MLSKERHQTATGPKLVFLLPLHNGFSALTLVWPIDRLAKDRVNALKAALSSVVSGGTSSRSAYEVGEFTRLKGVEQNISTSGRNLLLTISSPDDVFPETLVHLENLLLEPEYSSGWYERELQYVSLKSAIKTRRPSAILSEVADFLEYEFDDTANGGSDGEFRFGLPTQAILRSEDQEVERRTIRLLEKLPKAKVKWRLPLAKWAEALTGGDKQSFAIPAGTIHFADPNSTEMLILLVKAEEFKDEGDQIGTNLLMDYIGANQGSEMFQIIREEMRAAYDPRSDFIAMNKNEAIISLSATVEARQWPVVYDKIREIYESVRSGRIEQAGLDAQYDKLSTSYHDHFFNNPAWGMQLYLREYPNGVDGTISLPILDALETVSIAEIIANSEARLPPLEDFLLVLIGGGVAPTEDLKSKGFCALPKNTSLSFCLNALSKVQN